MGKAMELETFISNQRMYFETLNSGQEWDGNVWDGKTWLKTRGTAKYYLSFSILGSKEQLPKRYADFAKAVVIAIYKMKRPSFAALNAYSTETRRLYNQLSAQGLSDPEQLRNGHFLNSIHELREAGYKNIYDAANNLSVIANLVDKHKISPTPIDFVNPVSAPPPRLKHDPKLERSALSSKLPSKEAMEAFAICTNNPLNNREEILLRIIDLHIALGTRAHETIMIPLDCWIEQDLLGANGKYIIDPIVNFSAKMHQIS
jgi:hypothetical protein